MNPNSSPYRVFPFDFADRRCVGRALNLLRLVFRATPFSEEWWEWKYRNNPFGTPQGWFAEDAQGEMVALRLLWPWRFRFAGTTYRAYQPVDTATHPAHTGKGLFSQLTRAAIEAVSSEEAFLFNFPNEQSFPANRRLGWEEVSSSRWLILPSGITALRHLGRRDTFPDGFKIPDTISSSSQSLFATDWDESSLRWRFANHPFHHYFAFDSSTGTVIYRIRKIHGIPAAVMIHVAATDYQELIPLFFLHLADRGIPLVLYNGHYPAVFSSLSSRTFSFRGGQVMHFVVRDLVAERRNNLILQLSDSDYY